MAPRTLDILITHVKDEDPADMAHYNSEWMSFLNILTTCYVKRGLQILSIDFEREKGITLSIY
jgi:hypothetical protein